MKMYGGLEIQFQADLTLVLDGDARYNFTPVRDKRLGGPSYTSRDWKAELSVVLFPLQSIYL
jgi:hypothetical protein